MGGMAISGTVTRHFHLDDSGAWRLMELAENSTSTGFPPAYGRLSDRRREEILPLAGPVALSWPS